LWGPGARPMLRGRLQVPSSHGAPQPPSEHPEVKKRSRGGSAKSIGVLLGELGPPSMILPARGMERILAMGEAVVPELLSALEECEGDEGRDQARLAILLGELRPPDAVAPLARLLRAPMEKRLTVSVAAAEALAKIGPPAVHALLQLTEDPDPLTRLFAYGALQAIPAPEAYQALLRALEEEPEMAFVVAAGVACQGGEASTPALLGALERCPPWQRASVEDAIRMAHKGGEALPDLSRDWRLRYRLAPEFGVPDPGTLGFAAIDFESGHQDPVGPPEPLRTLEEILAGPPVRDEAEICEECGDPVVEETGTLVCRDNALTMALMQEDLLKSMAEQWGEGDLLTLLEYAEEDYLLLLKKGEDLDSLDPADPDLWEEVEALEMAKEEVRIIIRTYSWLLEQGVETVRAGRARLRAEAGILANRLGDPEGLLAPSSSAAGLTSQVGRNDPCPCGSGRKYKKCCGKGEGEGPGPGQPGQAGSARESGSGEREEDFRGPDTRRYERVLKDLLRFFRESLTRLEEAAAVERYFGPSFRGNGVDEALSEVNLRWAPDTFLEWLLFDYRRQSGDTLAEEYLVRKGWTLDPRSRAILEGSMASCMSLYRVEEVRPEKGLTLRDLFRGITLKVLERLGTREIVRWDIFAARVHEADGGLRLTGGIIQLEPQAKDKILLALEEEYVQYRVQHPGAGRDEFLKENADFFYQLGRAMAERPMPSLVTSEGDPYVFCWAHYSVKEPHGLAERMEAIPDLDPVEGREGEEGPTTIFHWVEPLGTEGPVDWGALFDADEPSDSGDSPEPMRGEPAQLPADPGELRIEGSGLRTLGTVKLEGGRLVLDCRSEARLARGKALLEKHLEEAIAHLEDVMRDPWEVRAEEKARGGVESAPPSEEIPPEVAKKVVLKLMERHYRAWLDRPLPALGGKSPRESVVTPGGRSRVADLIRQLERGEALRQRKEGYGCDVTWLWKELGLDPAKD
jgi:hypothetical protein